MCSVDTPKIVAISGVANVISRLLIGPLAEALSKHKVAICITSLTILGASAIRCAFCHTFDLFPTYVLGLFTILTSRVVLGGLILGS